MFIRQNLLTLIDTALAEREESERAFCLAAGIDHKVIGQLRRGENVTLATIEKLEELLPNAEVT